MCVSCKDSTDCDFYDTGANEYGCDCSLMGVIRLALHVPDACWLSPWSFIITIIMYHRYYHHCVSCDYRMQRDFLGELLEDLLEAFKTINLLKGKAKIIDARMPIIKCTLDFGQSLAFVDNDTVIPDFTCFIFKTIIKCTLDSGQFLASADDVTVSPDFFVFHFQDQYQMHPGFWSVSCICW